MKKDKKNEIKRMEVRDIMDKLYDINREISDNITLYRESSPEEWEKNLHSVNSDIRELMMKYEDHYKRGI